MCITHVWVCPVRIFNGSSPARASQILTIPSWLPDAMYQGLFGLKSRLLTEFACVRSMDLSALLSTGCQWYHTEQNSLWCSCLFVRMSTTAMPKLPPIAMHEEWWGSQAHVSTGACSLLVYWFKTCLDEQLKQRRSPQQPHLDIALCGLKDAKRLSITRAHA